VPRAHRRPVADLALLCLTADRTPCARRPSSAPAPAPTDRGTRVCRGRFPAILFSLASIPPSYGKIKELPGCNFSVSRMSSLEEPLGLGDLPKLSINRLGSFSQPSAYRRAAADDRNTRK
jgi:hypothetical protein